MVSGSTIAFICHEKERNLKQQQLVQGMSLRSYWLTNFTFDILKTLLLSGITLLLLYFYSIEMPDIWVILLLYPFALIPFTYATSFMFTRESSAQNCTIFLHVIISSIGSVGVFMLRIIKETEDKGDTLSKVFKFLPSFSFSNSMLYSMSKDLMNTTRNYTEGDILQALYKREELPERTNITLESFDMANMGGDVTAFGIHCAICIALLICIETGLFVKLALCIKNSECCAKNCTNKNKPEAPTDDIPPTTEE